MSVTLADLSDDEQLAFIGLAKLIIYADRDFSDGEARALEALAREMGEAVFRVRARDAARRFRQKDDVVVFLETITRPEARRVIFDRLADLARADGLDPSEERVLGWLAREWSLAG